MLITDYLEILYLNYHILFEYSNSTTLYSNSKFPAWKVDSLSTLSVKIALNTFPLIMWVCHISVQRPHPSRYSVPNRDAKSTKSSSDSICAAVNWKRNRAHMNHRDLKGRRRNKNKHADTDLVQFPGAFCRWRALSENAHKILWLHIMRELAYSPHDHRLACGLRKQTAFLSQHRGHVGQEIDRR